MCERARACTHAYAQLYKQIQIEKVVVTVLQSEQFFSQWIFCCQQIDPSLLSPPSFPIFPALLHMEGQWINMCRYSTAWRVMNWHYSGSLKTPSSHRSCARLCTKLSLCFGLHSVTWTNQGAGNSLTTTHNCPFPVMLPNNRVTLYTLHYDYRECALKSDRDPNLLEGCLAVQGRDGSLKARRNCRRFSVTSPILSSCNKGNSKSCHLDSSKYRTSCCWGRRREAQMVTKKTSRNT